MVFTWHDSVAIRSGSSSYPGLHPNGQDSEEHAHILRETCESQLGHMKLGVVVKTLLELLAVLTWNVARCTYSKLYGPIRSLLAPGLLYACIWQT